MAIFELQEMTHGYVGYDNNDVYIACPKCGEIVNVDDHKNDDKNAAFTSRFLFIFLIQSTFLF